MKKLIYFVFLLFTSNSLISQTLEITTQADKTDILTGESILYTLKYKCASTTTNCTQVSIEANIPSGIKFNGAVIGLTSDIASYSYSNNNKTVTFIFKEPLIAGNTGIIEITGIGDLGLQNGTVATMTASIFSDGNLASSDFENTTLHSYDGFCPQLSTPTGLGLDNTTYYVLDLKQGSSYAIGVANPGDIHAVDNFPANTIIDSVVLFTDYPSAFTLPLGTVNISGTTVTVDIPAYNTGIYVNNYTTSIRVRMYVRYPSAYFSAGSMITNSATVTHTPIGGIPIVQVDGSTNNYQCGSTYSNLSTCTCTTTLSRTSTLQNPLTKLYLNKTSSSSTVKVGAAASYNLNFGNTGNTVLNDVVIEDSLPNYILGTSIIVVNGYLTNLTGNEIIKYYIQTVGNPSYTEVTPQYQVIYPPVSGDKITAFKITINTLPAGAVVSNGSLVLNYTLDPTAPIGTIIQNCLNGTSSSSGLILDNSTACATITSTAPDPYSTLILTKSFTNEYGSGYGGATLSKGTIVYSLLNPKVDAGGLPLENPVVMDLLPKGVDYLDYKPFTNTGGAPPPADLVEVLPNYNGSGRTLVRFSWYNPWPSPSSYYIYIRVKINDFAIAGTSALYTYDDAFYKNPFTELKGLKNTGFFTGSSPRKCTYSDYYHQFYVTQDSLDVNGNGSYIDSLCYDADYLGVTSQAQLSSEKWVKGQCDTVYTRYPNHGKTMPGGLANYKLYVTNNGNVPATEIIVEDILPFIGDAGVIDLNGRLTQWRPNLVTPVSAPSGVTIYYSTAQNPCRTDFVASGPAGCTPANWSTILPTDPTTIQSLKFDFGTKVLNPGDQIELTWDMRAPVTAPTSGEIAWNSFAYKAIRTDNNDNFLPAEPLKVGIELKPNVPGNIGNYVWCDANNNGIQDNGEIGADGVRVELYKDNGDGINNPDNDLMVSFTSTANGGLYQFPNLAVGNYYLVFFLPPGYTTSPANATTDDKDSDGTETLFKGLRVTVTPITTIDASETDLTWDQGMGCFAKAALGNYVWFDENQNNIQDEPSANGVNGIEVILYNSSNTIIARDTTSNDMYGRPGYYLFDLLMPGDYYVSFVLTNGKVFTPSTGTSGGTSSDETDSDADITTGKTAITNLTAGEVDLTWDAGIIIPTGLYKLGNFVWEDTNNNGMWDSGEKGFNNVVVNLYNDVNNDGIPQSSEFVTTTNTITESGVDGIYHFDRLPAGDYIVQIPNQNFSGVLSGYTSSTGNDPAPDPDDNVENDDNGTFVTGYGVISGTITLGATAEPLESGYSNQTVDFGFYKAPLCSVLITAVPGSCNPTDNKYTLTGDIQLTNPPTSGTLTVQIVGGGSQSFDLSAGIPTSYSIANQNSDGASHTVSLSISGSTCTDTKTYTAPVNCLVIPCPTPNCATYKSKRVINN